MTGHASVWWEGPKRGPWKVRWRDGTKTASGAWRKFSSRLIRDVIERDAAVEAQRKILSGKRARLRASFGGKVSIAEAVKRYVAHHLALDRIGEAYALEFATTIERVAAGEQWTSLDQITADAIEAWRARVFAAGKSGARGVRGTDKPLQQIKRLLRWSAGPPLRAVIDPEALLVETRKVTPRQQPPLLTDRQVRAILMRAEEFGQPIAMAFEHLARYGCRPNELCRLLVSDWNPKLCQITHRKTKNRSTISHEVDAAFARRLSQLCIGRPATAPLYVNPAGKGWAKNKRGKYQEIIDWYWANVSSVLNYPEAEKDEPPATPQPWHLHGEDRLRPDQFGIYLLKDYAIQRMEDHGIDDKTKSTFTGITSMSVYARYKSSNQQRRASASNQIGAYMGESIGALQGALAPDKGTTAGSPLDGEKSKEKKN